MNINFELLITIGASERNYTALRFSELRSCINKFLHVLSLCHLHPYLKDIGDPYHSVASFLLFSSFFFFFFFEVSVLFLRGRYIASIIQLLCIRNDVLFFSVRMGHKLFMLFLLLCIGLIYFVGLFH